MSNQQFESTDTKKFTLTALLSFVVVFCFLMFMLRCHGNYAPGHHSSPEGVHTDATHTAATEEVNKDSHENDLPSVNATLPDGTELHIVKDGIEDRLITFLNDSTTSAGKDVWFDFDNLNFKTGGSEITQESFAQVMNIAAILKAYPKLKIKIGGYTDKTGDSAANIALSQSRATAVLSGLQKLKADATQLLGAEGYGAQFAKAAADAPDEERKKDRRISLGIREK